MDSLSSEDGDAIAAAQSDPQAFRPVFLRYYDPIFRYFVLRGASAVEAERSAMAVFAEALATLPQLGERQQPVLMSLLDIASKRGRPDGSRAPAPQRATPAGAAVEEMHRLLGRLDAGTAGALVLRLVAGLSFEETAAVLRASPAAVKMAVYRAVSKAARRSWGSDEG